MSEWGWVAFGYAVVYGGVAAYAAGLTWRLRAARRRAAGGDGGGAAP
jgi:hypothetical protein